MALELSAKKIRANCLLPGFVETEMTTKLFDSILPKNRHAAVVKHPLRLGVLEDVAYLSSFFLCNFAKWISGESIAIDGGCSAAYFFTTNQPF